MNLCGLNVTKGQTYTTTAIDGTKIYGDRYFSDVSLPSASTKSTMFEPKPASTEHANSTSSSDPDPPADPNAADPPVATEASQSHAHTS